MLLALLQMFNGKLDKLRLQKLLFLITRQQKKPAYDFIPYKYGCYSFSAGADLYAMIEKGQINDDESHFYYEGNTNFIAQLNTTDQTLLNDVASEYGGMNKNSLIKHTYINFPFYVINSNLVNELLDEKFIDRVKQAHPKVNTKSLYTIGYEGITLETYLNKLLKNDVKVLIDTRKNALSRKFGFSKRQLERYCNNVGIQYYHFPETGIPSLLRRSLQTQEDYDQLFELYVNQHLPEIINAQKQILNLLDQHERVALTCFEANICQCHRKPLAEAIQKLPGFNYQVKHL